jgi:putative FmdB family regulatory protein
MPLFEYECRTCGAVFEKLQKATEAAEETPCPRCGKTETKRRISSFACGSGATGGSSPSPSCGGGSSRFS